MRLQAVDSAKTCMLIRGDTRQGQFKRSITRVHPDRITPPGAFSCPSGYQKQGALGCQPIAVPQEANFVLVSAASGCSPTAIAAVEEAFKQWLSDPVNAIGVYTQSLQVLVKCSLLQAAAQVS